MRDWLAISISVAAVLATLASVGFTLMHRRANRRLAKVNDQLMVLNQILVAEVGRLQGGQVNDRDCGWIDAPHRHVDHG